MLLLDSYFCRLRFFIFKSFLLKCKFFLKGYETDKLRGYLLDRISGKLVF